MIDLVHLCTGARPPRRPSPATARPGTARRFLAALPVLGLLAACSRESDGVPPGTTPAGDADSAAGAPVSGAATPVASDTAILSRWRARMPAQLLVRTGACPFECCTYGDWRADAALPVVARQRTAGPPLFSIPAGAAFRADSGTVHITGVLLIAVADSVGDPPYWSYGPGDTLVVLDPIGEGHFNVWDGNAVKDVAGFWGAEAMPPVAEMIGRWDSEWWVHVTMPDGRTGWTRIPPGESPPGADACAG